MTLQWSGYLSAPALIGFDVSMTWRWCVNTFPSVCRRVWMKDWRRKMNHRNIVTGLHVSILSVLHHVQLSTVMRRKWDGSLVQTWFRVWWHTWPATVPRILTHQNTPLQKKQKCQSVYWWSERGQSPILVGLPAFKKPAYACQFWCKNSFSVIVFLNGW